MLLKDYGNLLRKEHWLVRMVFIFNWIIERKLIETMMLFSPKYTSIRFHITKTIKSIDQVRTRVSTSTIPSNSIPGISYIIHHFIYNLSILFSWETCHSSRPFKSKFKYVCNYPPSQYYKNYMYLHLYNNSQRNTIVNAASNFSYRPLY